MNGLIFIRCVYHLMITSQNFDHIDFGTWIQSVVVVKISALLSRGGAVVARFATRHYGVRLIFARGRDFVLNRVPSSTPCSTHTTPSSKHHTTVSHLPLEQRSDSMVVAATTVLSPAAMRCSDTSFGPTSCARSFDFTLTFEQSILSILPSCLLLLASLPRISQLSRQQPKTESQTRLVFKVVCNQIIPVYGRRHLIDD